jgi:hypothetical protein
MAASHFQLWNRSKFFQKIACEKFHDAAISRLAFAGGC